MENVQYKQMLIFTSFYFKKFLTWNSTKTTDIKVY